MPISVNWATKVINVPQNYLEYVEEGIYKLDVNRFRLDLKKIEASEEGIVFEDTHRHFPEVTLAGVTLARVVEFINGYTITFEEKDSPYRVVCYGANHNIADVMNVNTVSLVVGNTAGLIVVRQGSGLSDEERRELFNIRPTIITMKFM